MDNDVHGRYQRAKSEMIRILSTDSGHRKEILRNLHELVAELKGERTDRHRKREEDRIRAEKAAKATDITNTTPHSYFQERGWSNWTKQDTLNALNIVSVYAQIRIDRQAKRSKYVLYQWMSDNWEVIRPILDRIDVQP